MRSLNEICHQTRGRERISGLGAAGKPGVRDSDGVTFAPPVFLPFIFPVRNVNICEAGPDEGQRVLKDFERLHNNSYNNRRAPPPPPLPWDGPGSRGSSRKAFPVYKGQTPSPDRRGRGGGGADQRRVEEPKDSKQGKQLFGRPDQNTTPPWFKPGGWGGVHLPCTPFQLHDPL